MNKLIVVCALGAGLLMMVSWEYEKDSCILGMVIDCCLLSKGSAIVVLCLCLLLLEY